MEDILKIIASFFNKDQLTLFLVVAVCTLVGVIIWAAKHIGSRVSARLDKLEQSQSELNAKQDAFEKKVLGEYVSQDQLDRRIGGLKEMIAKLSEAIGELQTNFAVVMSHMGIVAPKPVVRKTPTKKKGKQS